MPAATVAAKPTSAEAQAYLLSRVGVGVKLGLDNTWRLLSAVGNVHQGQRYVHVAGTNGKGSVCALVAAVLEQAGNRTGLYTSPHLVSERERIRVDGRSISEDDFATELHELRRAAGLFGADPPGFSPSYFELVTVLAFMHYARVRAGVSVIEVGMGGRLDATNVITPLVSVITGIDFDHTRSLGDTLDAIAGEKAGIIKPGVPVVCGETRPEAVARIAAVAAERQAPLYLAGRDFAALGYEYVGPRDWPRLRCRLRWREREQTVETGLLGRHQAQNLATALATLAVLREHDLVPALELDPATVAAGFARTCWPARLQRLPDGLLLDGAHNPGAMNALAASLAELWPGRRFTMLFGVMHDKDWGPIIDTLAPCCRRLYLVHVANPRCEDPAAVRAYLAERWPQLTADVVPTVAEGLARLRRDGDGLILGSLYLAGEVLETYTQGQPVDLVPR